MRTTRSYFSASARRASTAAIGLVRLIAEGEGLAAMIAGAGEIAGRQDFERLGRAEIERILGVARVVPHRREHGDERFRQLALEEKIAAMRMIAPARRLDGSRDVDAVIDQAPEDLRIGDGLTEPAGTGENIAQPAV